MSAKPLLIAFVLAVVSAVYVPPSAAKGLESMDRALVIRHAVGTTKLSSEQIESSSLVRASTKSRVADFAKSVRRDQRRLAQDDTKRRVRVSGSNPNGGPQQVGAGGGILNPYVSFNRVDQAAILAGSTAAIAAAICLVSGPVGCAVAGTLIAVAATYLAEYGRCPTRKPNYRSYIYPSDRDKNGCYR